VYTQGGSQYPAYSQYQSGGQSPQQSQPVSQGYGSQSYGSSGGTLPSWAYTEPMRSESAMRYPASSQYQPGGGERFASPSSQSIGPAQSSGQYAPRYVPPSGQYQSGSSLPYWTRQEPTMAESSLQYPVSSQYQPGGGERFAGPSGQSVSPTQRGQFTATPGYIPPTGQVQRGVMQPAQPSTQYQTAGQGRYGATLPSAPQQPEHYSSTYQPQPYSGQAVPQYGAQRSSIGTSSTGAGRYSPSSSQGYQGQSRGMGSQNMPGGSQQQQSQGQYGMSSSGMGSSYQDPSSGRRYGPY
jgi:hypothetical protein